MNLREIIPPLHPVKDPFLIKKDIKLFVLRADLIHPHISGNKLYKLKYNIEKAKEQNKKTLITFGGAFSNHIAATAAAGREFGFQTIGFIRGEEHNVLNPTLTFAKEQGMQLHFISREEYRKKDTVPFLEELNQHYRDFYLIPEGGANELGLKGCKEIIRGITIDFDFICCACGTGTTLAGIILSLKAHQHAIGFQILNAKGYLKREVQKWLTSSGSTQTNWTVEEDYHFGGYAKVKPELVDFVAHFKNANNISLDYIYTGKMMSGIFDMISKDKFKKGTTLVAIHTGGLQGNEGFKFMGS